jgi:hypothetical protein
MHLLFGIILQKYVYILFGCLFTITSANGIPGYPRNRKNEKPFPCQKKKLMNYYRRSIGIYIRKKDNIPLVTPSMYVMVK